MSLGISVIIPALNEAKGIAPTLKHIQQVAQAQGWDLDLVVVDDGSTDETGALARQAGARVIRHPTNGGYGLSLQDGIQAAHFDLIAFTDADGTYPVAEFPALVSMVVNEGFDMAVGARTGQEYRKGWWKYPARILFRWLAEYVAGRRIPDINSGLRVIRREKLLPHLAHTCLGFSFTTSITLIFFLNGLFVGYRPVSYARRIGTTKVRHFHDTLRTGQILVSVISAYNPIKLFLLIAFLVFLMGVFCFVLGWIFVFSWLTWMAVGFWSVAPLIFSLGCLGEAMRLSRMKN